jgi:hypothetical protein
MQAEADRKRREEQTRMSKEEQRDQAFADRAGGVGQDQGLNRTPMIFMPI